MKPVARTKCAQSAELDVMVSWRVRNLATRYLGQKSFVQSFQSPQCQDQILLFSHFFISSSFFLSSWLLTASTPTPRALRTQTLRVSQASHCQTLHTARNGHALGPNATKGRTCRPCNETKLYCAYVNPSSWREE